MPIQMIRDVIGGLFKVLLHPFAAQPITPLWRILPAANLQYIEQLRGMYYSAKTFAQGVCPVIGHGFSMDWRHCSSNRNITAWQNINWQISGPNLGGFCKVLPLITQILRLETL